MDHKLSSYFFFILLIGAVVASVLVFLPFITPLVLAGAGAVLAYPLYRLILRILGEGRLRKSLAALITVICILVVIVVPLFFLAGSIYSEIQTLYASLTDEGNRSHVIVLLNSFSQSVSNMIFGVLPAYSFDSLNVTEYLKSGLELLFANLDKIFNSLAVVGGYALVFLLALFYFLRDGAALIRRILSWSPQLNDNYVFVVRAFRKGISSIFMGSLVVCILEGISTGLAFTVFGIPAPALWGTVAAIVSLVPGFGTSLIIIPGVLYLIVIGQYTYAFALLAWGYLAIFLLDHVLGPTLVNKGVNVHPFLVLLSVLGGLVTFGIVGLFLGPLILVLLFTLLDIYKVSTLENNRNIKDNK
ncbi:MAG: AI-2E family transporter [Candidatus Taylorbacteria bacterium]